MKFKYTFSFVIFMLFFAQLQAQTIKNDTLLLKQKINVKNENIHNTLRFEKEISNANDTQILVIYKEKYYSFNQIKDSLKLSKNIKIITNNDSILKYFDKRIQKIMIVN